MRLLYFLVSIVGILTISTFFSIWFFSSHVFPNTFIGSLPISFMNQSDVEQLLTTPSYTSATVKLKDRMYVLSYESIGLFLNEKETLSDVFSSQKNSILLFLPELFSSFFQTRRIPPSFEYSFSFSNFIQTPPTMMKNDDVFIVDENGMEVITESSDVSYQIQQDDFIEKIKRAYGNPDDIIEPLLIPTRSEKGQKADTFNAGVARMSTLPINLYVKDPKTQSPDVTIPSSVISSFITVSLNNQSTVPSYVIDRNKIETYLANEYQINAFLPSLSVTASDASYDVENVLNDRFAGGTMTTVYATTKDKPHSNGTLSPKYIEIDLTNQRMFLFQNGNMVKTYKISSGKDFPTPPGSYKILNKALNAYSGKYHVYMPYWMAFYYHPTLQAYFGIHELPYYYKSGEVVRRPRINIGTPATGGCVALDLGQAKEVYEYSDIGMPVYIFE